MLDVRRGGNPVQVAPAGFAPAMGVTAAALDVVASTMSASISGLLTDNTLVMGQLTAGLRGAASATPSNSVAANGTPTSDGSARHDNATIGGTELLMSPAAADRLGIVQNSSVVMWNP